MWALCRAKERKRDREGAGGRLEVWRERKGQQKGHPLSCDRISYNYYRRYNFENPEGTLVPCIVRKTLPWSVVDLRGRPHVPLSVPIFRYAESPIFILLHSSWIELCQKTTGNRYQSWIETQCCMLELVIFLIQKRIVIRAGLDFFLL